MTEPAFPAEIRLCNAEQQENDGRVKTTLRQSAMLNARIRVAEHQEDIKRIGEALRTQNLTTKVFNCLSRRLTKLRIALSEEQTYVNRLKKLHVPESHEPAYAVLTKYVDYPTLSGLPLYAVEFMATLDDIGLGPQATRRAIEGEINALDRRNSIVKVPQREPGESSSEGN